MRQRRLLLVSILWIASALAAATSGLLPGKVGLAATPPPLTETPITPPPLTATATPSPSGQLIRYTGQLLDLRGGFAFFTTGDAFRLAPGYKVVDAATGGPPTVPAMTRTYARAAFDTGNGSIVQLGLSPKPLPPEANYQDVARFAVALSTSAPNPDLIPHGEGYNGKPVLVIFTVEIPPQTPFNDDVYLATDVSGWSATAIKMDRIDATHYRVERDFLSGTRLLYRYTLGSWSSAERGQDGLEVKPRLFLVPNADVKSVSDTVYHWGNENPNAPDLGENAPPTPYNPIPFFTPPRRP